MAKYLIHCVDKRKWYVDEFLVPSMIKQGIEKENILIYNDTKKLGNLRAFLSSADMIGTTVSGTWHLQDDIIISSKFREVTETYDHGIVCGFCNQYSKDLPIGIRPISDMWYSFPCIRIPNSLLKSFVKWVNLPSTQNKYRTYIEAGKFDDTLFRAYVTTTYKDKIVRNICPNIVDNVDYLLGGSLINYMRDKEININSLYFNEKNLVEELKHSIENSVYKRN